VVRLRIVSCFEGCSPAAIKLNWGVTMRKFVISYLSDESGAAAAEYALILAIVGGAIAAAAIFLGSAISTAIHSAATCVSNASTCTAAT
jgi:pilus assembly protein Flp/PilA